MKTAKLRLSAAVLSAFAAVPAAAAGFAADLASDKRVRPDLGRLESMEVALRKLARSSSERQPARWNYARSLIAAGRAADAVGVLEVMLRDEPDLGLTSPFQLAYGRVLVELGRGAEAVAALEHRELIGNPEACAWRMRAFALVRADGLTAQQMACAKPTLAARNPAEREPFVVAAARAATGIGQPQVALHWLRFVPATPSVLIARGEALLAGRKELAALPLFKAAQRTGTPEQRAQAELGLAQARLLANAQPAGRVRGSLEALAYRWRGGEVERRALLLLFKLAREQADDHRALASAAMLIRYHPLGPALPQLLGQAQAIMAEALAPDSHMPLEQAAGLYWDYRDLAPAGGEGDLLALRLADRLQDAGLYQRAAGLLDHQLVARANDLAQGPLSVRVAKLHILSGRPERALDALRLSSRNEYPAPMRHDRQRVEAVALQLLGRGREALAVLQTVPGSGALQAELLWKQRSWAALADLMGRNLPPASKLSELRQAMVLRQAIALAMLGREDRLAELRSRYAAAFAPLPTGKAFDLLTRPAGAIDAESLTGAMAAIPSVSPAGPLADLLDAAPVPQRAS